jgi:hypothetical protein
MKQVFFVIFLLGCTAPEKEKDEGFEQISKGIRECGDFAKETTEDFKTCVQTLNKCSDQLNQCIDDLERTMRILRPIAERIEHEKRDGDTDTDPR